MCPRDSPRWLTYFIFASVTLTALLIYCFCYKLLLVLYTADSTLTKDPMVSSWHSWKNDRLGDNNSNLSDHRTNSSAISIDIEHSSQEGIKNQNTIGWSLKQTLKLNETIKASSTSSLKRTRTYTHVAIDSSIQGKLNSSVYGELGCPDNPWKKDFYELFRHWIQISKQYNIKYVLACGSLLGAMRDGDVIPYDSDIDVLVEHSYFSILERLSVKRDFNPSDGKIRLVVQPEFALNISIDKRRMFNCEGKVGIPVEGRRGYSTNFVRARSPTLYRKRYPFCIPSTDKWYPFHIPCLELWHPFYLPVNASSFK